MSTFWKTNTKKILLPSWKRRVKIIFNPIFKKDENMEEIITLISLNLWKKWFFK